MANKPARSPAARSSRSPELPSSGGGPHRSLMLCCDVEELEWRSGSHSAFLPLFTGVSRVVRFLLSPTSDFASSSLLIILALMHGLLPWMATISGTRGS